MMNRRKFFTSAGLAAGAVTAFPSIARPATQIPAGGQRPRRIIHMVADGMSLGTLTAADYFSQHQLKRELRWVALGRRPGVFSGFMNMRSLNSMVTDSSAASSSWGSGSRVVNGTLNQLPSGKSLTPLYTLFAQQGWKRGLVTTTEITHATPAGFVANADSRENGSGIATQYLQRKVDLLLGGGRKFFEAAQRKDKRDLKAEFVAAGYQVFQSAPELSAAKTDAPWLGIFSDGHLPYFIDRMSSASLQAQTPELAMMTQRALDWLQSRDQFILQVEGGRVDHAAHNCDAPAALREMLSFDAAVGVVLDFQEQHPDTLVVITTDHGNGNLGVNSNGSKTAAMFARIEDVKSSFVEIMRQLRQRPAAAAAIVTEDQKTPGVSAKKEYVPAVAEISGIIESATGYKVSERRAALFQQFLAKQGTTIYDLMNSEMIQLGQLLANHITVGWTGGSHTADFAPVTAVGPGAERFAGFIQNTDIFRHYTQLAGIDFRNPEEPLIAAADTGSLVSENTQEYALA